MAQAEHVTDIFSASSRCDMRLLLLDGERVVDETCRVEEPGGCSRPDLDHDRSRTMVNGYRLATRARGSKFGNRRVVNNTTLKMELPSPLARSGVQSGGDLHGVFTRKSQERWVGSGGMGESRTRIRLPMRAYLDRCRELSPRSHQP